MLMAQSPRTAGPEEGHGPREQLPDRGAIPHIALSFRVLVMPAFPAACGRSSGLVPLPELPPTGAALGEAGGNGTQGEQWGTHRLPRQGSEATLRESFDLGLAKALEQRP